MTTIKTNKKVARIITRLNIGGPSLQVFLLYKSLKKYGFSTDLYCGELAAGEKEMTYLESAKDIELKRLKGLGRAINPIKDIFLIFKLYRIFKKTRPDIVHTHHAKAGGLARLAAKLAGVPVIIHTFHGNVFRGHFGKIKTTFFIWLERFAGAVSTRVIAISQEQKKDLVDIFKIVPRHKVEVIPLGFDLSRFKNLDALKGKFRKQYNLPKDKILIGLMARLEPVKNLPFLLQVAEKMHGPEWPVHFVIVGDGQLRQKLEETIKDKKLEKQVSLTGFVQDIPSVLADLDIVCLCSHSEGTPVSLIEAMAARKPVLSTRVGGVADVITDNETGLLVTAENLDSYAEKLGCLVKSKELREKLGKAGQKKVFEIYTEERLTQDIASLYDKLLSSHKTKV